VAVTSHEYDIYIQQESRETSESNWQPAATVTVVIGDKQWSATATEMSNNTKQQHKLQLVNEIRSDNATSCSAHQ